MAGRLLGCVHVQGIMDARSIAFGRSCWLLLRYYGNGTHRKNAHGENVSPPKSSWVRSIMSGVPCRRSNEQGQPGYPRGGVVDGGRECTAPDDTVVYCSAPCAQLRNGPVYIRFPRNNGRAPFLLSVLMSFSPFSSGHSLSRTYVTQLA